MNTCGVLDSWEYIKILSFLLKYVGCVYIDWKQTQPIPIHKVNRREKAVVIQTFTSDRHCCSTTKFLNYGWRYCTAIYRRVCGKHELSKIYADNYVDNLMKNQTTAFLGRYLIFIQIFISWTLQCCLWNIISYNKKKWWYIYDIQNNVNKLCKTIRSPV